MTHILTETDGPFAGMNGKPYHPWDVIEVLDHLAQLHGMPVDEIKTRVWQNFLALSETCGLLGKRAGLVDSAPQPAGRELS